MGKENPNFSLYETFFFQKISLMKIKKMLVYG